MDSLNSCDVVWDSPSKDSSGSMPLGNGDIGVNAWVEENGDLLFFISKTDAWSDCGRLLKLGQVRIRLDPPLVTASGFSQRLRLRDGCIEIRAEGETLKPEDERRLHSVSGSIPQPSSLIRLWIDANRPVIHLEAESQRDMQAQVSLNVWRTKDRDLQQDYSALGVCRGGVSIIEKADVVLPQKDNRIVWYHRNELTIYPLTMQVQGLESLTSMVPDPLLHRTFGGCISGTGFVQAEADDATQALKTAAPTRRFDVAVHVLTAQTETSRQWQEQLDGIVAADSPAGLDKTWAAHCGWWEDFWNRSWIRIHTPEDDMTVTAEQENARRTERAGLQLFGKDSWNDRPDRFPAISGDSAGRVLNAGYSQQRFITAASGRGAYPIKFNGSIFCVNTQNPKSLSEADYRQWGPNYWWQNTRLVYWPMPGSGDYDMMMPLFAMYRAMVPMAEARTRLYYKHDGVFFPETLYPWGAYPNDEYSFAKDWGRGGRPAHLLENIYIRWYWQGGIELTAMMLDCYDGTQDKGFLRNTLLPVATGVTTFFDQHWKRDENGKIRFEPACSLEACRSVVNPLPEIAGLRYILPRLCALPVDVTTAPQRAAWTLGFEFPCEPYKGHFTHHCSGNVCARGRGVDLALDHHRYAPYENLFTDLDAGAGTRLWKCGGGADLGKHCGARGTFWNIRAARPLRYPGKGFGPLSMNLVAVQTDQLSEKNPEGRWFEVIDPRKMEPQNLHAAQLARRQAIQGKTTRDATLAITRNSACTFGTSHTSQRKKQTRKQAVRASFAMRWPGGVNLCCRRSPGQRWPDDGKV